MIKYLLLCVLCSAPLFAQQNAITLVGRQYVQREDSFTDRPYGDSDVSYGGYWDVFDGIGGWRFGATYASGLSGVGEADSVITPEITLMGAEGVWQSGVSVMIDYIDTDGDTDWSDVYYQFQLGLSFPIGGKVKIGAVAFFPFNDIGDFRDIGFSELDYGVTVGIKF